MVRNLPTMLAVLVLASACGGSGDSEGGGALAIEEYVAQINGIAIDFDSDAAQAGSFDFPLEGELGRAAVLFTAYDRGLDAMRRIEPPAGIRAAHEQLVTEFQEMQDAVSEYLQKASLEGGFTIEALNNDPVVSVEVAEFFASCSALANKISTDYEVDAEVPEICGP